MYITILKITLRIIETTCGYCYRYLILLKVDQFCCYNISANKLISTFPFRDNHEAISNRELRLRFSNFFPTIHVIAASFTAYPRNCRGRIASLVRYSSR